MTIRRYLFGFVLLALAGPALAQQPLPLPLLFTVTGIAEDDTLNVRDTPSASAPDVGDIALGEIVEIVRFSDDGKWGMVANEANFGWVSTHYLTRTPNSTGDGISLPYGVPLALSCSGGEPFWSLDIASGRTITLTEFDAENPTPITYPMQGLAKPLDTGAFTYGFSSPPVTGVIRNVEECRDMSYFIYGWAIDLVIQKDSGVYMLSGCCTATPG